MTTIDYEQLMEQGAEAVKKLRAGTADTKHCEEVRRALVHASEQADADGEIKTVQRLLDRAEAIEGWQKANAKSPSKSNPNARPGRVDAGPFGDDDAKPSKRRAYQPLRQYDAADLDSLDDANFEGWSDFLLSVKNAQTGHGFDNRLMALNNTQNGAAGGFTLPERLLAEVLMSADQEQPFLRMRNEILVNAGEGGSLTMPIAADRDRSDDDVAGLEFNRVSEGGTIANDAFVLESLKLELNKAACLVKVSSELLQDSAVNIDAFLRQLFGRALALRQARDFIDGNGTGSPLGYLNSPAAYEVAEEGSQTADTILAENLLKMQTRASRFDESVWIANPETAAEIAKTHILGTNSDGFLMVPGNGEAIPTTVLGRPIYYTEAAPRLGERGDVSLVRPASYNYLSTGLRVDLSRHVAFEEDVAVYRALIRDDGRPTHRSTLLDASGFETSDFVVLGERS